jgi:hypothetical protein
VKEGCFFIKERPTWQDTCTYGQMMVGVSIDNEQKGEGKRPTSVDAQSTGLVEQGSQRKPERTKERSGLRVADREKDGVGKEDMQGENMNPDWRQVIISHLSNPGDTRDKKVHIQAMKYVIMDDELYQRTVDGILLKCLGKEQS